MTRRINIELIEAYRYDQEIAKTDFCRQLGVDIRTYNKILEDPTCRLKDGTIFRIAKAIDKSPVELITFQ